MKIVLYVCIVVLTICYLISLAINVRKRNNLTRAKLTVPVVVSLVLAILWLTTMMVSDKFIISAIFMYFFIISFIFNLIELQDYTYMLKKENALEENNDQLKGTKL